MDWVESCRACFDQAVEHGIPVFMGDERASTPLNGSPYVIRLAQFIEIARSWPGRSELVESFQQCLDMAESHGVAIQMVLIGGSFTDLRNTSPRDLDSLWVYRLRQTDSNVVEHLKCMQRVFKLSKIDMRFVAADGELSLMAKAISYFTLLYSKVKGQMRFERGLLLVDCSTDTATA